MEPRYALGLSSKSYTAKQGLILINPLAFDEMQIKIVQVIRERPIEIWVEPLSNPFQVDCSQIRFGDFQSLADFQIFANKGRVE